MSQDLRKVSNPPPKKKHNTENSEQYFY